MSQSDHTAHWMQLFEASVLLVQPGMRQIFVFWILQGQPAASCQYWRIVGWRGRRKAGKGRAHWNLGLNCGMLPDADMGCWQKHSSDNFLARVHFLTIIFMLWNWIQGKNKTWRRMRLPFHLDYHDEQCIKVCWLVFQGFGLFLGAVGKWLPFQRDRRWRSPLRLSGGISGDVHRLCFLIAVTACGAVTTGIGFDPPWVIFADRSVLS